jgi:hypothetical protein
MHSDTNLHNLQIFELGILLLFLKWVLKIKLEHACDVDDATFIAHAFAQYRAGTSSGWMRRQIMLLLHV